METTLPRVLCAGAGERTPGAGWARRGRAQGRASVGCSREAGAAPFRAAGTWPRGCSLGEAGDGDGGGEPSGGSQPRTEVTGRSSPLTPSSLCVRCCPLVPSPPSPQPRAQIVAPPGLAPVADKLPESCTQEPKLHCREALGPFSRCTVLSPPSRFVARGKARGWWGVVAFLEGNPGPRLPQPGSFLRVFRRRDKRAGASQGPGEGGMWGRGGPAGWGPAVRDAPPARVGEAGAGVGVSRRPGCWPWGLAVRPSVRRVSLAFGTGLPARLMAPGVWLAGAGGLHLTSDGDSAGAGEGAEHPGLRSALEYETRNCSLFLNAPLLSRVVLHPGMPALSSFSRTSGLR